MVTLPIMLFDEHQLAPSSGYLFNPKWVSPHESIVSMLWKFGRANTLPGHVLITQIAKDTIDPYEGISACPSGVNLRKVSIPRRHQSNHAGRRRAISMSPPSRLERHKSPC